MALGNPTEIFWTAWLLLGGSFCGIGVLSLFSKDGQKTPFETLQSNYDSLLHRNREMRLAEQKMHTILRTTTEGFLILDTTSKVIADTNPAFCNLLGYQRSEIINRCPVEIIQPNGQHKCKHQSPCKLRDNFMQSVTTNTSYETVIKTKDDKTLHVRPSFTYKDGSAETPPLCFAFLSDLTARKNTKTSFTARHTTTPSPDCPTVSS